MASFDGFLIVAVIAAGLAIGLGVIFPSLGQAHAATRAMHAMARQPDEAATISRNLYVGLAMIESQALYVLIVSLILLFANPLISRTDEATAHGSLAFWLLIGSTSIAALAITIGTMLSSFGQGRVTGAALDAIAEQPAARDQISTALFISLALLESLALYALIISLIVLFANPIVDRMLAR